MMAVAQRAGEARVLTLEDVNRLMELEGLLQFAESHEEEIQLWDEIDRITGGQNYGLDS